MLELWGIVSTPSLPSFPGPLRPGLGTPDRVLPKCQIELNSTELLEIELFLTFKLYLR